MFNKGTWINRGAKQTNHPIDALLLTIQDVNNTTGAIEASKAYLCNNIDPQDILPSLIIADAEQLLPMFTHRSIVEEEINNARKTLDGTQSGGYWANAPLRNTLGVY